MKYLAPGVIVVVCVVVIAGFLAIGSPTDERARRFDQQRIWHLQTIQGQIVSTWQIAGSVPAQLDELNDDISGFRVPGDTGTGAAYEYTKRSPNEFTLCAVFTRKSDGDAKGGYPQRFHPIAKPMMPFGEVFATPQSWSHAAGRVCFDRSIDTKRYKPPIPLNPQP